MDFVRCIPGARAGRGLCLLLAGAFAFPGAAREPVDYVNTEIGTISHLLAPSFRTVQRPNGMLRFLPPNSDYTVDRVGPLHLQYPGHRARPVFRVNPYSGPAADVTAPWSASWDQPHGAPYAYDVLFDSCGVKFTIAPANQAAIATFEFRRADELHAVVFSPEDPKGGSLDYSGGFVTLKDVFRGGGRVDVWLRGNFKPVPTATEVRDGRLICTFAPEVRTVSFRYGVSYIDAQQAEWNLSRDIGRKNIGLVAGEGRAAWNAKLGRIEVEGGSEDEKSVFYSALWRCYERMVNITEDGRYRGWDGAVHPSNGVDQYTDDWIWDTFRAHHPLMTILEPTAELAKLTSYLRMSQQNKEKWMPTFPGVAGDGHNMINHHVAITYYDAWMKGLQKMDLNAVFAALDHTERTESLIPWYRGPLTELDRFHQEEGFFPALKPGEKETCPHVNTGWELRQSVSVTLGACYDAWALAGIARILGNSDRASYYEQRAKGYVQLWHPGSRFFRPCDSEGEFIEPFDPIRCGGRGARNYFTENNAWTYIWDVQHDLATLRELLGGAAGMAQRLDEMLNTDVGVRFAFVPDMPDGATGLMGNFSMANEPSFHIPYLYNYAGMPHKTQKFVRKTLEAWFRNDKMGMCGDEDGGGMSAYAVFSMMGFYPVTPGLPEYQIGSPVFTRVTIHLENGKDFVISAPNASKDAKYWERATLGEDPLEGTVLPHAAVVDGKTLTLEMHQ